MTVRRVCVCVCILDPKKGKYHMVETNLREVVQVLEFQKGVECRKMPVFGSL